VPVDDESEDEVVVPAALLLRPAAAGAHESRAFFTANVPPTAPATTASTMTMIMAIDHTMLSRRRAPSQSGVDGIRPNSIGLC